MHNCERFGQLQLVRATETSNFLGKMPVDMPKSILVFQFGSILFYQGRVRSGHACESSRRPHGRLMFCSLFAGRRCLRLFRHCHDNVFLDHRQHSLLCVCSCSKVPIAPMGKLLTHFLLASRSHNCECFGQLQGVRATETLKTSHRPDADVLALTHACTTAARRFGQL